MSTNKFGLSRHIPKEIQRKIRQNSKYGCVVPTCRNIIYEYEHLIPEFKDAEVHDPNKICLTCPTHNPRKTGINGEEIYSKEQLISFYEKIRKTQEPIEISNKDIFSGFNNDIVVQLGGLKCDNVTSLIEINGENIFSLTKNKEKSSFAPDILFNGRFEKPNSELLFEIIDNEWKSNSDHGDITYKNGTLEIFDDTQSLVFSIRKIPSENLLIIDKLNIWINPFHVYIENDELIVARHDTIFNSYIGVKIEAHISHQESAIKLSSTQISDQIDFNGQINYSGDYGLKVENNGISIASGSGISRIKRIYILTSRNGFQSGYKFMDVNDYI